MGNPISLSVKRVVIDEVGKVREVEFHPDSRSLTADELRIFLRELNGLRDVKTEAAMKLITGTIPNG